METEEFERWITPIRSGQNTNAIVGHKFTTIQLLEILDSIFSLIKFSKNKCLQSMAERGNWELWMTTSLRHAIERSLPVKDREPYIRELERNIELLRQLN